MRAYDYALAAGFVATSAVAMWYQVRYYKLVDELISALSQPAPEDDE